MLWLIRNHFETRPSMSVAHSITDLTNHPWLGDDRVAEFIYKWDFLVTSVNACGKGFATPEGQDMLPEILRPKLAKSELLKQDLAYMYIRESEGVRPTYAYLRERIAHYLARTDLEANRGNQEKELKAALKPPKNDSVNATPAESGGNKKNTKKHKKQRHWVSINRNSKRPSSSTTSKQ